MPRYSINSTFVLCLTRIEQHQDTVTHAKVCYKFNDCIVFYTLIEQCDPDKVKVVSDVVYNYNDINPLNDYKINSNEQTKNANRIITQ